MVDLQTRVKPGEGWILNNQFKSVLTKPKPNISTTVLPQRAGSTIQNLKITVEGVEKLLKKH